MIVSENFPDLLEPGLRAIFTEQYDLLPQMRPLIFNVQSADTSYVKDSSIGGFGDAQPFQGTIPYDDVFQGNDVTYNHIEYAKGFKVERTLWDDDLYNIIQKKPMALAQASHRTEEKLAADVFNNAFTGSGTITIDGVNVLVNTDSVSMCNSAHSSGSGRIATTFSNTGTSQLSPTSVEASRREMASFKDDTNNLISVSPDTLLVPRALEETAWQIISTRGEVASAQNNANFHYGRYKLAVWDYLSSSSAWWLIDSVQSQMFLNWYDRVPMEFFQDKDFDTLVAKFAVYWRASWGWSDWRWLFGNNPS